MDTTNPEKFGQTRDILSMLTSALLILEITLPLLSFLVALIGGQYSFGWIGLANNNPVRLILLFAVVLGVAGMTDRMFIKSMHRQSVNLLWLIQCVFIFLACSGIPIIENTQYGVKLEKYGSRVSVGVMVFGLITLLFARLFVESTPRRGPNAIAGGSEVSVDAKADPSINPSELSKWGLVLTLAFMIMALFFLSVEFKPGKEPTINYYDIAAVLMVFLLAELGLKLVVDANSISRTVQAASKMATAASDLATKASSAAQEAVKAAKEIAEGKLAEVKTELETANDTLGKTMEKLGLLVASATAVADTQLWREREKFADKFGFREEPRRLWTGLDIFGQSWLPHGLDGSDEGHPLVGELFESFIGESVKDGSVRRVTNGIACITADSVFAEVCGRWLKRMEKECCTDEKLVVWAVTELLPSEFALPAIWWEEESKGDVQPRRTRALTQFAGTVLAACATSKLLDEYKRVTIFRDPSIFDELKDTGLLDGTLNNWFVWDPRVPDSQRKCAFNEIRQFSCELVSHLSQADTLTNPPFLGWRELSRLVKGNLDAAIASKKFVTPEGYDPDDPNAAKRLRVLPIPGESGAQSFVISDAYFGDGEIGRGNVRPPNGNENLVGGFLGMSNILLSQPANLADKGLEYCPLLAGKRIENLRGALAALGWEPIGTWYCNRLHFPSKVANAHFAVLMKGKEGELPLSEQLRLAWDDDFSVRTLDLLMIGTRKNSGKINWLGAAISNISFDRTECTVQLIADRSRCEKIEEALSFCFGRDPRPKLDGIVRDCETWDNWNSPTVGASSTRVPQPQTGQVGVSL